MLRLYFLLYFTLFTFVFVSNRTNAQCAVDVIIQQGASIAMCANAPETINASGGYVSYSWTGPQTFSTQNIVPNFSGTYTVEATDGVGCVSSATINVTINPVPVDAVISSEGDTLCPGITNTALSLSNSYLLYQWNTGETTPEITVSDAGTYSANVADANGCVATFSFDLASIEFDLVATNTGGCVDGAVALTASGGKTYLWSTGETGTTIVVSPASPTSYSVTISDGSCVQTLSTVVQVSTELPEYSFPDTLYTQPDDVLLIAGPEGFDSYLWSPTSLVSDTTGSSVYFIGDESATLVVESTTNEGCVITDSVRIIIVKLTIPNGFSPNFDNINDTFVVPELYDFRGSLTVWNRWGDIVYESSNYQNDWNGTCSSPSCFGNQKVSDGTYYYLIDISGITFKGYLTIKE